MIFKLLLLALSLASLLQCASCFILSPTGASHCSTRSFLTCRNMNNNNEKEMSYEERVSENPSNVENLIKFAHFLQGIGKYDRAAKMYSTALQFDSEEARRQSFVIANSKNASIEIRSWEQTEIANLLEYNTLSQVWSARKVLLRWESSKPYSVGGQRECKRLKVSQLDALDSVESGQLSKRFTAGLTSGGDKFDEEHVRDYFREVLQQVRRSWLLSIVP